MNLAKVWRVVEKWGSVSWPLCVTARSSRSRQSGVQSDINKRADEVNGTPRPPYRPDCRCKGGTRNPNSQGICQECAGHFVKPVPRQKGYYRTKPLPDYSLVEENIMVSCSRCNHNWTEKAMLPKHGARINEDDVAIMALGCYLEECVKTNSYAPLHRAKADFAKRTTQP